jgi:leucyl aminopeptidase
MAKLEIKLTAKDPVKQDTRKARSAEYFPDTKILQVYLGAKKNRTLDTIRKTLSDLDWKNIAEEEALIHWSDLSTDELEAAYEMIVLKSQIFAEYKTTYTQEDKVPAISKLSFQPALTTKSLKRQIKLREQIVSGITFCRSIVSSNAADINAGEMERLAKYLASKSKNIKARVIDAAEAKKLGMNCLLAVGAESLKNSSEDFHPRLVILQYSPDSKAKSKEHLALIGKGITFDTGGLCLKPNQYMLDMKSDMTGSAVVLSVFQILSQLPAEYLPAMRITGILALAENAFGASSYKPGDVLKAMNGKTVQVVDTDAEGRLVLADALSYASTLKPTAIIDLATLTGSVVATLGEIAAGAMTNDDKFLQSVQKAFADEGEKIWQLPIFDEYKDLLKSDIADIAHCNTRPDALLAAIFLREFVGENIKWLHLDIAGMGFIENDGLWAYKGATGFAVKGLMRFLGT